MQTYDASSASDLFPAAVLSELQRLLGDFVLIGSFARVFWTEVVSAGGLGRATHDVDVSVAVHDLNAFHRIARPLGKPEGTGLRFRVLDTPVDVIPWGSFARDGRLVPEPGVVLHVHGLAEASRSAVTVVLTPDLTIKVASLPAMVALKLVAWGIRGGYTDKDAVDVAELLDVSWSGPFEDPCYDDPDASLFNFEAALVGPYLAGRTFGEMADPMTLGELDRVLVLDELTDLVPGNPRLRAEQLAAFRSGLHRGYGAGASPNAPD